MTEFSKKSTENLPQLLTAPTPSAQSKKKISIIKRTMYSKGNSQ